MRSTRFSPLCTLACAAVLITTASFDADAALLTQSSVAEVSTYSDGDMIAESDTTEVVAGFDLFDSALGQLTDVRISFTTTVTGDYRLTNNTEFDGSFSFDSSYGYHFGAFSNGATGVATGSSHCDLSGQLAAQSFRLVHCESSAFSDELTFSGAALNDFIGNDFFTLQGTAWNSSQFMVGVPQGPEYPYVTGLVEVTSLITLTYIYDSVAEVPEPLAILLGAGLFGFPLLRRKKAAR